MRLFFNVKFTQDKLKWFKKIILYGKFRNFNLLGHILLLFLMEKNNLITIIYHLNISNINNIFKEIWDKDEFKIKIKYFISEYATFISWNHIFYVNISILSTMFLEDL